MASMTLANYRTRVAAKLGLDSTADLTLIDAWVNEGYEDVLTRTHCKVRPATMALTSGTHTYSLPTAILAMKEVYNTTGTGEYLLERLPLQELAYLRRTNASTGNFPSRYYSFEGADMITLYPTPGTGESLTLWYVPRPTALSAVGDIPSDVPAEFHKLLEYWACAEAAEYSEHKPSQFGLHWKALYEKQIGELKRAASQKGGSRLEPVRVGRRSGRYVPPNPSVVNY